MGQENYIAPGAQVIGDVQLGENASVWHNAVVRADDRKILIGEETNIQDNATLHVEEDRDIHIGRGVTVGHNAIVHGCTVGDNTVIGMGAIIMNGAVIGDNCIVGAGAVVTENQIIAAGSLVLGIPGKVVRTLTEDEKISNRKNAENYVRLAERYSSGQCVMVSGTLKRWNMKVYGTDICIDCRNYRAIQAARGFEAEFIDITENTVNLREFLSIRDHDPVFDAVREHGGIGIPLFVRDDGAKTLDIDEAFAWLGQEPVREEEIVEQRK
jgi:carbonic anhydrase/acetyltransferase-like protein (isoleucine patch superfamily)/glutaredoxin-related protein